MLNFRLLSFLEVYRTRSFSRAAENLCLTQPAVSQHIKFLEEDFDCELFQVRGREVAPTRAAEILYRYAETAENDGMKTRDRIASEKARTRFRFGATRTIGEFVLPTCISSWLSDYPHSEISMVVDNSENLFASLHAGTLDFVFIEGVFNRDEYSATTLIRDRMIPVCAPGHRLAFRSLMKPADWEDLLGETLIVREPGSGSRLLVEQALAGENLNLASFRSVLEIGNIGAIKELVGLNAGIAFLYGRSVEQDIRTGALDRVEIRNFDLCHDYSFVRLKKSVYENEYADFFSFCRSHCGAVNASF